MPYFTMPYQVLFHDTMAYGTHHHAVNVKIQNVARETLLFASGVDGREVWREQLAQIVMLTREVYSLNLAPIGLGERIGVLMTYEEPTFSTVRLCFRIVGGREQAIACGFQTMILMARDSDSLVGPPPMLARYLDRSQEESLIEPLVEPSFRERVLLGGRQVREIFPPEITSLGAYVANARRQEAIPRILDLDRSEVAF